MSLENSLKFRYDIATFIVDLLNRGLIEIVPKFNQYAIISLCLHLFLPPHSISETEKKSVIRIYRRKKS